MFDNNGSFLLALFEIFIFAAWFMCLFWVFADVFRSRDLGGGSKTLWVLFIIILPLLGMLVYLIARGPGMSERSQAAYAGSQPPPATYTRSVAPGAGAGSAADQITSAKALLDSGAINAGEFEQLKATALGRGNAPARA
jgi:phospholipase D-like protein